MKTPLLYLIPLLTLSPLAQAKDEQARILIQADSGELEGISVSEGATLLDMEKISKDPEKAKRTVVATAPVGSDQWTTFSVTFQASQAGGAKLRLSGDYVKGGETWVLIDNVKSEGVEIANPDFEFSSNGSSPSEWQLQKTSGKQGEYLTDGGVASSGEKYVKVSHAYPVIQMIQLPEGKEVTITVSARTAEQP